MESYKICFPKKQEMGGGGEGLKKYFPPTINLDLPSPLDNIFRRVTQDNMSFQPITQNKGTCIFMILNHPYHSFELKNILHSTLVNA